MKKFIVIGNPIKHSLSPYLHNWIFEKLNLSANYSKVCCDKKDLPKTINQISAEKVAQSIFDLLGIAVKIPYERVHIGKNYNDINIQNVPSSVARINHAHFNEHPLIVRMDVEHNEEILSEQLKHSVCVICSTKPIDRSIIMNYKQRIQNFVYYLDDDHDKDFVEFLRSNAVSHSLLTRQGDKKLEKLKLEYLDYGFIFQKYVDEEGLE